MNSSLTDSNTSESFNFGSLNGVRGFYTSPSRADDSFIPFSGNATVIQLSSKYSAKVNYSGKINVTFELPSGYTYIGAGIIEFTASMINGGFYNTATITENNGIITLSAPISGNWGNTTITGTVTLAVFVKGN